MIRGFIKYSLLAAFIVGLYFAVRQISKYIPHAMGFFIGLGYNVFDIIKSQITSAVYGVKYAIWYIETALAWGSYYAKLTVAYLEYYSEIYTGSSLVLPCLVAMGIVTGIVYVIKARHSDYSDYRDYEYS